MVGNPFQVPWVAPAYAAARPNVHERFIEVAKRELGSPLLLARGLDIGCGTGLSSQALRHAAQLVVGIDPAISMIRYAGSSNGLSYLVVRAEAIPAGDATFDVASPCPRNAYFDPEYHVSDSFTLHATTLVAQTVRLSMAELSAFIFTQASTVSAILSGNTPLSSEVPCMFCSVARPPAVQQVVSGLPSSS